MPIQSELIFNRLLTNAFSQKATDLYLSIGTVPFMRKDGLVKQIIGEAVVNRQFLEELINVLLNPVEQEELKLKKEVLVMREFGRGQHFRLVVFQERGVPALNVKFIASQIPSLEQLKIKKSLQNLVNLDKGLVIVGGPRDSGRSTLVLALLDWINKNQQKYITTLERPIEYFFLGGKGIIEQREIGRDTANFLTGISSIRSRNIDVVFISEFDDAEVILALLEIAQTDVLVFTIMNVDTVLKVLQRILDIFPKERQDLVRSYLTDAIKYIICTRLVPRVGGDRILATEILKNTPIIQKAIREQRWQQIENVLQGGFEEEVSISLDRHLAELVKSGQVLSAEAIKYAIDKDGLQVLLRE